MARQLPVFMVLLLVHVCFWLCFRPSRALEGQVAFWGFPSRRAQEMLLGQQEMLLSVLYPQGTFSPLVRSGSSLGCTSHIQLVVVLVDVLSLTWAQLLPRARLGYKKGSSGSTLLTPELVMLKLSSLEIQAKQWLPLPKSLQQSGSVEFWSQMESLREPEETC